MAKPTFSPGKNIAVKVPSHEYEATVAFYRDVLGFEPLQTPGASSTESVRFAFGDLTLWIDRVPAMSQAEIWLEVRADDADAAAAHLEQNGCARRDDIEPLPEELDGFWISNPANIIHLITAS